jgi:DNA-binding MarR family transcriptional regulator
MTLEERVQEEAQQAQNTVAMLGRAYSLLGFQIVDGVVGAGYPQKPSHSAVFAQIRPEGNRLTELARGANMTPQAMGELVDELEALGYVERRPDPSDRRAKLILLTERGHACIAAGVATIDDIERRIDTILGAEGHGQLRRLLAALLAGS